MRMLSTYRNAFCTVR